MKLNRHEITAIGIFSGLAVAGGYLFIAVPNVEIFTAIIFLSGFLLGPRNGMLVGIVAQTFYSILNPFGSSPPPLLIAQVLNRAIVGHVGGKFGKFLNMNKMSWTKSLYLGAAGLLLTWLYDLMAYLSFFFLSGFSVQQMKTTFALGLLFYLIHGVVNTAIFALVLPFIIRRLTRMDILNTANLS
ncbi:MAG: ECF transporter S component [bacterium]